MRLHPFKLVIVFAMSCWLAASCAQAASQATVPAIHSSMENWWVDLEKSEPESSRALLEFSSHPVEAVTFLKRKLRPLSVDPDIIQALLTQLGSSKESEWKPAFEDLEYFDPRLAIDLQTLMDQVKESPTRQRLVEVLSNMEPGSLAGAKIELIKIANNNGLYNFFVQAGKEKYTTGVQGDISKISSGPWDMKPQWTRAVRAIVLLEHIGTPDAVAIVKDMATGNPDAQPTKVAQAALARLANRNPVYNSKE